MDTESCDIDNMSCVVDIVCPVKLSTMQASKAFRCTIPGMRGDEATAAEGSQLSSQLSALMEEVRASAEAARAVQDALRAPPSAERLESVRDAVKEALEGYRGAEGAEGAASSSSARVDEERLAAALDGRHDGGRRAHGCARARLVGRRRRRSRARLAGKRALAIGDDASKSARDGGERRGLDSYRSWIQREAI